MTTLEFFKPMCTGRWPQIIAYLAPKLEEAVISRPNHVPCPVHGGKDGLRAFNDFDETGGMVCNTCGPFSDGYKVLKWLYGLNDLELECAIRNALDNIDFWPGLPK